MRRERVGPEISLFLGLLLFTSAYKPDSQRAPNSNFSVLNQFSVIMPIVVDEGAMIHNYWTHILLMPQKPSKPFTFLLVEMDPLL